MLVASCSDSKKVGSAIDVESLDEKASRLGKLDVPKKNAGGGFVGEKEREQEQQQEQTQALSSRGSRDEEGRGERSSVAFNITS